MVSPTIEEHAPNGVAAGFKYGPPPCSITGKIPILLLAHTILQEPFPTPGIFTFLLVFSQESLNNHYTPTQNYTDLGNR